jgi:hypothetical protein
VRWACGQHGKTTTTTTTCSHQRARLTRWVVTSHFPLLSMAHWFRGLELSPYPLPKITNLHVVAAVAPQLRAHVVDRDHDDVSLHPKDPCCTEKNPTHYDQRWRHGASLRVPTCKLSLRGFPTFQLAQVMMNLNQFLELFTQTHRPRATTSLYDTQSNHGYTPGRSCGSCRPVCRCCCSTWPTLDGQDENSTRARRTNAANAQPRGKGGDDICDVSPCNFMTRSTRTLHGCTRVCKLVFQLFVLEWRADCVEALHSFQESQNLAICVAT